MTDAERNTALAALFGPEGYEAAKTCPQGHNIWVAVEHPNYDDHDEYVEDIGYQAGALCLTCITLDDEYMRRVPTDRSYYAYDKARFLRHLHKDDWVWHPEWRIQSAPKDFTVPGVLEPLAEQLLEKWNQEPAGRYYMWTHTFLPNDEGVTHAVNISYFLFRPKPHRAEFRDTRPAGYGEGMTYEVALAEALLDTDTERRRA